MFVFISDYFYRKMKNVGYRIYKYDIGINFVSGKF